MSYVLDVMNLSISSNVSNVVIHCLGHYHYQKRVQHVQNLCLFVVWESQRVQVSWTKEDVKNLKIASMGTKLLKLPVTTASPWKFLVEGNTVLCKVNRFFKKSSFCTSTSKRESYILYDQ